MITNTIENRFNNLTDGKSGLSASGVERLLKEHGFNISRKYLATLSNREVIRPPTCINDGKAATGRRIIYDLAAVKETIAVLLAAEASGIKGKISADRIKYIKYSSDAVKDVMAIDSNVKLTAHLTSLTTACLFLPSGTPTSERLIQVKLIARSLKKILLAMWFVNRWINSDNYHVLQDWYTIRDDFFDSASVKRFSSLMLTKDNCSGKSVNTLDFAKDVMCGLENNENAKKDLRAWVEILMAFPTGTKFIADEAEKFMWGKHGLGLDLQKDTVFKIGTLYKLLLII